VPMPLTDNYISHHGVLGMKWGVRKDRPSSAERKLAKSAQKDAKEYAEAKVSRGEGAGNRRKQINAIVEQRKSTSDFYAKSFDDALSKIDQAKAVNNAESWRTKQDVKKQTVRSTKAIARAVTGTSSLAAAGIFYASHKTQIDQFVKTAINTIQYQSATKAWS